MNIVIIVYGAREREREEGETEAEQRSRTCEHVHTLKVNIYHCWDVLGGVSFSFTSLSSSLPSLFLSIRQSTYHHE